MRTRNRSRFFALLLCLAMILPTVGLAEEIRYVYNQEDYDRLNLRKTPDVEGESIGRFYKGTTVRVLDMGDTYAKVRIGDLTGYMQHQYLITERAAWAAGKWGTVNVEGTGQSINLRAKPNSKSTVLQTYPNGTAVQILGESGDFYHVRAVDFDGYMQKSLLVVADQNSGFPIFNIAYGTLINDKVNLRSYPSRQGTSILQMNRGKLMIIAACGPWYYVTYPWDGTDEERQYGFVLGNQLALSVTSWETPNVAVVNNPKESDRLILRGSASASGAVLGRYFNDTQVEVLEKNGSWWRVRVDGKEGYMDSKYLQAVTVDVSLG